MTLDIVKKTILKLESICESYETPSSIKLEDLEETVDHLSHEVQMLDIASNQTLKTELTVLENALERLSLVLKQQQERIEHHVKEINVQQRALYAYARVANNNIGTVYQ